MDTDEPVLLDDLLLQLERMMDPAACLQRAADALEQGDLKEARAALADYRAWREGQGFEPAGGDELERRLRDQLRQLSRKTGVERGEAETRSEGLDLT